MEILLSGSGLNTAFIFALCAGLAYAVYTAAEETARKEYRKLSRPLLITHILFFWLGGSAFAAAAIAGLVNGSPVDGNLWTFLFAIIAIPGACGLWRGLSPSSDKME